MKGLIIEAREKQLEFQNKYGVLPNILLVGEDTLRKIYQEVEYMGYRNMRNIEYNELKAILHGMMLVRTKEEYFEVAFSEIQT